MSFLCNPPLCPAGCFCFPPCRGAHAGQHAHERQPGCSGGQLHTHDQGEHGLKGCCSPFVGCWQGVALDGRLCVARLWPLHAFRRRAPDNGLLLNASGSGNVLASLHVVWCCTRLNRPLPGNRLMGQAPEGLFPAHAHGPMACAWYSGVWGWFVACRMGLQGHVAT